MSSMVARVGRDGAGIAYRVVHGWRHAEVERNLDAAVAFEGASWWIDIDQVDELEDSAKYWRAKQQRRSPKGVEAQRENNRRQAAKWRDKAREEWRAYALAYMALHGGGTRAIGFDRWCRHYRELWLRDPAACVSHANVPGATFNESISTSAVSKPVEMMRLAA